MNRTAMRFRLAPSLTATFFCALAAVALPTQAIAHDEPVYRRAAVAADHPVASRAGLEMLERGGNAVDAAVAASFCLSVVRPYSCGIGGGGFMVIHIPADHQAPAQQIVLNYRETAPAAVAPEYFVALNDPLASRFGARAVGVPGTVAGLLHALEHYGTLDRAVVLQPAIRAAREGVPADANHVAAVQHLKRLRDEYPELRELSQPIWETFCLNGTAQVGDLIRQPAKARTLQLVAEHGADVFYRGEIAEAIARTVQSPPDGRAGALTLNDLSAYAVIRSTPLRGSFYEYELLAMPPPSSGGIAMIQILGIMERVLRAEPTLLFHNSPAYVHLLAEAMKHAFADRAEHLADAAFVNVPIDRLIDPAYLDDLASRIDPARVLDDRFGYGSISPAPQDGETLPGRGGTSHLSVIDSRGMAVACTETINLIFGSLLTVPDFGIVLNNEMDDFTTIPGAPNAFGLRQSDRNLPEPGKRPLSSMSPTILVKDGRAVLVAGASGGPRIITGTAQALLNSILFNMRPAQAVGAARFHHQWMPMTLQLEANRWSEQTRHELAQQGHTLGSTSDVGVVQLIRVHEDGIRAASDPRKGGAPAGH
ncbi:MAG TPA: gamma-glutamyltransferase [Phycisphaerales bacterium]|nr:gamma-glutamyltransferase [Phycisphaerales bacterium]